MCIGFPISPKEHEHRRALLPQQVAELSHPENCVFELGYGRVLGISDDAYREAGARMAPQDQVLSCPTIVEPKIGDAPYLHTLVPRTTIFGWVHAEENPEIAQTLIDRKLTAYAWEHMHEDGRHIFWRNNQLAGESAVLHAYLRYGKMPYETNVAVIGRGETAVGAVRVLQGLGAHVTIYRRTTEQLLRDELDQYDVVVNCVLWDLDRQDHILSREDVARMKPGSMIVDVSCDAEGGVETSRPTTIETPIYTEEHVVHYVVDHTPSIMYKTATTAISEAAAPYVDQLLRSEPSDVLNQARIAEDGKLFVEVEGLADTAK